MTSEVFPMLGIAPIHGRVFLPEEETAGREREVVLGYGLWRRSFAGDPAVVGKVVRLDGEPYTVIGVMPKEFDFPPFWATGTEMWAPIVLAPSASDREGQSLRIFARLRPGVSLSSARAEMASITARLEKQYPGSNRDVTLDSLVNTVVGDVRPAILVLFGAVLFVLLIACANVAHMLLARAAAREREVAIRASLGASRRRMIRQLLTESLVLALSGGASGTLLAVAGTRVLVSLGPPGIPAAAIRRAGRPRPRLHARRDPPHGRSVRPGAGLRGLPPRSHGIASRGRAWLDGEPAARTTARHPDRVGGRARPRSLRRSGIDDSQVLTMERVVGMAVAGPRFYLLILGVFAGIALVLSAVGIYGVMSYSVSRRTHEIGLRMALGAEEKDVLRLVVRQGMTIALIGAGVGLAGAFSLTRLMSTLLYGVGATDPATFLAVSLVLTAVALAASYLPARRASRVDPLVALRHQ